MNEGQTRRTGQSLMMTSRRSRTSQSHKQVAQTKSHKVWNVDAGTGTGNCVNEGQTRQTDESQMMTSRWGRTSESHKRITQSKMTSLPRMEITNDTFGCSRATNRNSSKIEFLGLVIAMTAAKCDCNRATHFMRPTSM